MRNILLVCAGFLMFGFVQCMNNETVAMKEDILSLRMKQSAMMRQQLRMASPEEINATVWKLTQGDTK